MALSQETVQSLIDYAVSDPDFVKDLLADPESAIDSRSIDLQPGELEGLESLLNSAHAEPGDEPVEALQSRISHSLVGHDEVLRLVLIEHFLRSAGGEE